uniref:Uncharacterized protein n=1 Tax=Oryza glumipatula TaxID=40148 RepID=A0A0E0AHT4_9ORYZ
MAFYVRLVLTASLWILFSLAVGGATLHADESGGAGKLWSVVTVVFGWSGQPDYIDAQPAAPEEEWSMVVAAAVARECNFGSKFWTPRPHSKAAGGEIVPTEVKARCYVWE